MDIMNRGGGIVNTVDATRKAAVDELVQLGIERLDSMLSLGVTTVEGKSGYGLDRDTEIKQLEVMTHLDRIHYMDVVPTFLGAHAVPEAYKGKEDAFIEFMISDVLPRVAEENLAEFCDIFCEKNVFSVAQSRRLLSEAKALGLKLKLHADEIVQTGGAELAAELGAVGIITIRTRVDQERVALVTANLNYGDLGAAATEAATSTKPICPISRIPAPRATTGTRSRV